MLKKKKNKELSVNKNIFYDVYFNNSVIAQIKSYKDYVKRKETDTIRTKYSKLQDVNYKKSELCRMYPDKIEEINKLSNRYKIEPKEGSVLEWIKLDLSLYLKIN